MFSVQAAADARRLEFDSKNEELLYTGKRIFAVFIGDSITHAFELGAYFASGAGLLVNRGIGGDIPFYIEKRFRADVLQLKPRYAVILCGINETWGLDGKCGAEMEAEKEQAKTRILKPYRRICGICEQEGQKLVIGGILPTYGEGDGAAARKRLIIEVNQILREICREKGFGYVDYHEVLAEADGMTMRREYSYDGCHVNASGYGRMAEALKKTMAKMGEEL